MRVSIIAGGKWEARKIRHEYERKKIGGEEEGK